MFTSILQDPYSFFLPQVWGTKQCQCCIIKPAFPYAFIMILYSVAFRLWNTGVYFQFICFLNLNDNKSCSSYGTWHGCNKNIFSQQSQWKKPRTQSKVPEQKARARSQRKEQNPEKRWRFKIVSQNLFMPMCWQNHQFSTKPLVNQFIPPILAEISCKLEAEYT